ncbi:MAG: hypothetical protein ABI969_08805 [bacterium]
MVAPSRKPKYHLAGTAALPQGNARNAHPFPIKMLLSLGVVFALQVAGQATQPPKRPAPFVRDSSPIDSVAKNAPRRLAVTATVLATAFHDEAAKELFYRAHQARMTQDSSLRSYDANVRARISATMKIGSIGPERVMYRQESASRVRWQQGVGARVELTGARLALPIAPKGEERNELLSNLVDGNLATVPYYPGYEALWLGGRAQDGVDDRRTVNPLADGAEAYYTYESGDSISSRLPNGTVIQLRELKVRPRQQKSNLAVGSLMFDIASGQLVWAAYRLAAPADMWANMKERADTGTNTRAIAVMKAIAPSVTSQISEVTIEYSLFDGRFWLPRSRAMKGFMQVAMVRMPVAIEHSYRYTNVNGGDTLPPITVNTRNFLARVVAPDSLKGEAAKKWRDSVMKSNRLARDAMRDSLDKGPCDATGNRTLARDRYEGLLAIAVTFPCNVDKLTTSSDFTTSIYDANEEVFGSAEREALISRALSLGAQAPFSFLRATPQVDYGLSLTRYNRIEGFSTALRVAQQLGDGYSATVTGRIGFADREPNVELAMARTNLTQTISLTGYNRLVSASDWGRPLSFSASMSALLFGRDDGFYYRASGAELGFNTERGLKLDWRLFAERQRTATPKTAFSVGGDFGPNIVASLGTSAGAAVRFTHAQGLDPQGFRTFTDVRLEAAGGDSTYGRGAMDITLSRGLIGDFAGAVTLAGGSTIGGVPMQRRWFLGGTHTVRGQSPDTAQSGNAFWLTRAEVGREFRTYRATVFGDLGWVGDRTKISEVGRPLSGVGVGMSLLDGMARVDFARGLYPKKEFRVDLSLGARW